MLTARFVEAFAWAHELHRDHTRKATGAPYITHLMAVASLAIEDAAADPNLRDGLEDVAIAGLLHDAVEDTDTTVADIVDRFGPVVGAIVDGCTDTTESPKPPWKPRKQAYLDSLECASDQVLCVSLADKRHNSASMLGDLRALGPAMWSRFNAGPGDQIWLYEQFAEVFERRRPGSASAALRQVVNELRREIDAAS